VTQSAGRAKPPRRGRENRRATRDPSARAVEHATLLPASVVAALHAPRSAPRRGAAARGPSPRDARRTAARGPAFLGYVHSFRAVAIVAVILTHVDDFIEWGPGDPWLQRLVYSVAQNGTVLFLFIAGFLFQHLSSKFVYSKYLEAKLRNVVAPYLFMSSFALARQYAHLSGVFAGLARGDAAGAAARVLRALLTAEGLPAPFWFVPVIAVFYAGAPLLLAIDRRPKAYRLLPAVIVLGMLVHRPFVMTRVPHAVVYCAPAYLAGMCFSHHREAAMSFFDRHRSSLAALALGLVLVEVFVLHRGGAIFSRAPFSTEAGVVDVNLLAKLIVSCVLLPLLRRAGDAVAARLDHLAEVSFGVFFVHWYVLQAIERAAEAAHVTLAGTVFVIVGTAAAATMGSLALLAIVRRATGRYSRYLVGC